MKSTLLLPIERLHEVLTCNFKTGVLTWKHRPDQRSQWNGKFALKPAGAVNAGGYISLKVDGTKLCAHHVVWAMYYGQWPDRDVEHKDHCRSNNRIRNLRASANRKRKDEANTNNRSTGIKGVSAYTMGLAVTRYAARLMVNGVLHSSSGHKTLQEAHATVLKMEQKYRPLKR